MAEKTRVPIIFIAGLGRSGSTLISRTLGTVPGFFSVGELFRLWDHGVQRNEMCGCGLRFLDCDFWRNVGKEAFGGWGHVDIDEVLELHNSIVRTRYLPLLIMPKAAPAFRRKLTKYSEIMSSVYQAIRTVSGCNVVVDSSKTPAAAYMIRHIADINLRMVHLVRSSYGVCYSHTKIVRNPGYGNGLLTRQPPTRTATEWMCLNLTLDALGLLGEPKMLLRYEDFIARPRTTLQRIIAFAGESKGVEELPFHGENSVELPRSHSIAGNPMRNRTGLESLALDNAWRTELSQRTKRVIAALTGVGLARYRYPPFNRH
ncbi:sulfotransferase [Nonomuraea sp. 10N515B]|uniref:sulfotransferase n=1 Tax=Nonomuraea sp. 10N515B TaxID=3457422 RepID=UPI003FCDF062